MAEQDCARIENECERNVMTELTVGTTYSVASPLANMVIKTFCHFNIENMQLTIINFLSIYITSSLLWGCIAAM